MRRNWRMALGALGIAAACQIAGVSVADAEPIDNTDAVVTALTDGEGERAAELIRDSELRTDPQKLGSAINAAGTKSVEQGTGGQYKRAVAIGFTRGGVDILTATQAFTYAATEAVAAGLTPEEALVGGATLAQTYQAYLVMPLMLDCGCPRPGRAVRQRVLPLTRPPRLRVLPLTGPA